MQKQADVHDVAINKSREESREHQARIDKLERELLDQGLHTRQFGHTFSNAGF